MNNVEQQQHLDIINEDKMAKESRLEQVVKKEVTKKSLAFDLLEKGFKIGGPTILAPLAYVGYKIGQVVAPEVTPMADDEGLAALVTLGGANAASLAVSYGDDLVGAGVNLGKKLIGKIKEMPPIKNDVLDGVVSIGCYAGLGLALDMNNNFETNWRETLPMIGFFGINMGVRVLHKLIDYPRAFVSGIVKSYKTKGLIGGTTSAIWNVVKLTGLGVPAKILLSEGRNFTLGFFLPLLAPAFLYGGYDVLTADTAMDVLTLNGAGSYVKELVTQRLYSPAIATWASGCWLTSGTMGFVLPDYDPNKKWYKQKKATIKKYLGFDSSLSTASIGMAMMVAGMHLAHAADAFLIAPEKVAEVVSDPTWYESAREGIDKLLHPEEAIKESAFDKVQQSDVYKTGMGYVVEGIRFVPLLAATYTLALYDHLYKKGARALHKKQKFEKLKKSLQAEPDSPAGAQDAPQDPTLPTAQTAYGASTAEPILDYDAIFDDYSGGNVRDVMAGKSPTQGVRSTTKKEEQEEPIIDLSDVYS
jgi:hypothetical protein